MQLLLTSAATATGLLSALALYLASPHCTLVRVPARMARRVGWFAAAVSLAAWIEALGPGAGTCAMLLVWMLGLVAAPCLAAWRLAARGRA